MRKLLLSLTAIAFGLLSNAQVSITSLASPYTQNFDSLSNDTVFTTTHPMALNGWAIFERGSGTAADQLYKVNNGTRNNGETYSYGDSTSTERSLGSLASASNLPSYGVGFKNSTGAAINTITVSYKGEQWRSGDTTAANLDSLIFEYSTTAMGINDTLASWNAVSGLSLTTPNLTTAVVGPLDGNNAPNTANISGSISVLLSNNSVIYFRWRDINKIASDDGLAIDDLSVSFSASGNPKPSIVSTTPADNSMNVNPTLTSLSMTFDQAVVTGTGDVIVKNLSDATQQNIPCASTTISGNTVSVPGVTLVAGKQYAVNYDSTCYQTSAGAKAYGIYDNTSWNFETNPTGLFDYSKHNLALTVVGRDQLRFDASASGTYSLHILDMNGRTIAHQKIAVLSGENKVILPIDQLHTGIYFVQVSNAGFTGVVRFEKQ